MTVSTASLLYLKTANDTIGQLLNVFEAVDVITVIKGGQYDDLTLSVGIALQKRSSVSWKTSSIELDLIILQDYPGIYTCSLDDGLDTIFDTIRKSRVHRIVIVDDQNRLEGVLSLSDILQYILLEGEQDDN
jgi:5'-AMP-activated protein kinase, regulatory gamma subunit